eukprot:6196619-Pleurochrysis_carterae.AAC.4
MAVNADTYGHIHRLALRRGFRYIERTQEARVSLASPFVRKLKLTAFIRGLLVHSRCLCEGCSPFKTRKATLYTVVYSSMAKDAYGLAAGEASALSLSLHVHVS